MMLIESNIESEIENIEIEDVQTPITSAPSEVKQIIEKVCKLEKSRLARKSKAAINDDIITIIKEAVQ